MDLFLGLDLGTSNLKALVMTDTGAIVARGASSYPLLRPQPGWAVQHPGAWWAALVAVLADLRAHARCRSGVWRRASASSARTAMAPTRSACRPIPRHSVRSRSTSQWIQVGR